MSDVQVDSQQEEQIQLAREIGDELTDAFVAYVKGDVAFDDLTFGVYDALSDLHVIASGEYELDDENHEGYDESEAIDEQEELAQEPSNG
ncbi:MAG: hypothetical protein ACR2OU_17000 [Thermomicrobiales bacterium]